MAYMSENDIATVVVDTAYKIHQELGPGLFESIYESVMNFELAQEYGLFVRRQVALPVVWKNNTLDVGFRTDMIIENKLIIEIKSVEIIAPVHFKQLLTYLRLTNLKLGLLINFNEALIKNGIKRVVNGL